MNEFYESLLKDVKKAIQESGWSQNQLAKRLNMSTPNLNHVLQGRRYLSLVMVAKIGAALGKKPRIVFDDEESTASKSVQMEHAAMAQLRLGKMTVDVVRPGVLMITCED